MVPPVAVRRLGLPVLVLVEVVVLGLTVVGVVVGVVAAVVDRRARVLRLAAMGAAYVGVELLVLAALLAVRVAGLARGGAWRQRADLALTARGLGWILGAARRTVGLAVVTADPPAPTPLDGAGPVLVMARHGGIGDSFAVVWLLAAGHRLRPRVVLKSALLWDPMIDVALSRLGACFLSRAARRRDDLEDQVGDLAGSLVPGDALLIFPEGGNWTPRRRLRAMGHLWSAGRPRAVRAAALMEHVLPPRPAGVLAALGARPDLPVVLVAHAGLDRLTSAGAVWRALPFDRPMVMRWWETAPPPPGATARAEWLNTEWAVLDEWVAGQREGPRDGSLNFSKRHHSSES